MVTGRHRILGVGIRALAQRDLELIAQAFGPEDMLNHIVFIPL